MFTARDSMSPKVDADTVESFQGEAVFKKDREEVARFMQSEIQSWRCEPKSTV